MHDWQCTVPPRCQSPPMLRVVPCSWFYGGAMRGKWSAPAVISFASHRCEEEACLPPNCYGGTAPQNRRWWAENSLCPRRWLEGRRRRELGRIKPTDRSPTPCTVNARTGHVHLKGAPGSAWSPSLVRSPELTVGSGSDRARFSDQRSRILRTSVCSRVGEKGFCSTAARS